MKTRTLVVYALIALASVRSYGKGDNTNAFVYAAAAQGDVAKLKEFFAGNTNLLSLRNGLLQTAALSGQGQIVEYLISIGTDVNQKGFFSMTPLAQIASSTGLRGFRDPEHDKKCAQAVEILVAHGAVVDPVDDYGVTPLLHAVESVKSQMTEALLAHGADLHRRYIGVNSGRTPLHMAVSDKDKETVAALLKFKAPVDAVDRDGVTPLAIAEGSDQPEIAAMLRSASPAAAKDVPIYSVAPTKEEIRALVQRICEGDNSAFDELNATTRRLYSEIKDYQTERPRLMVIAPRMKSAIDLLGEEAGKGNEKALLALKKSLEGYPFKSFVPDALGVAAAGGNKEALDILLHFKKWDILESSAQFALCLPAKANIEPAVDYWVDWLGSMNEWKWGGGIMMDATNALASAATKGNQKAREALAKLAPPPVTESEKSVETSNLLTNAFRNERALLYWSYLIGDTNMLNRVLESKAFDSRDFNGDTPLMWAVKARRMDFARQFLEHGAPIPPPLNSVPGFETNSGLRAFLASTVTERTPLLWVITHRDPEMLKLLLEFNAPFDAVDQDGKTALHYAVSTGNREIVRLLLEANPSLDVAAHDGATPLVLAETAENKEIAGLLRQSAAQRGLTLVQATAPSSEEMRVIARRICDGDTLAFDELKNLADQSFAGAKGQTARSRLNGQRIGAAFSLLGEEAAKGNDNAFQALKKCLPDKLLKHFAFGSLGAAAVAGHKEALEALLDYKKWGILDNSACFALAPSAKANLQPAVDFFIALALDPKSAKQHYFGVAWLIKEVLENAADSDNARAKDALEKFIAATAQN